MNKARSVIFVLEPKQDEKVDAIADHLSKELGVAINRSKAVRLLIDRFFLPDWSPKRPLNAETTELTA
jgi:hypothetical protein